MPTCPVILDPVGFQMKALPFLMGSTKVACTENKKRVPVSAGGWDRGAATALGWLN